MALSPYHIYDNAVITYPGEYGEPITEPYIVGMEILTSDVTAIVFSNPDFVDVPGFNYNDFMQLHAEPFLGGCDNN